MALVLGGGSFIVDFYFYSDFDFRRGLDGEGGMEGD